MSGTRLCWAGVTLSRSAISSIRCVYVGRGGERAVRGLPNVDAQKAVRRLQLGFDAQLEVVVEVLDERRGVLLARHLQDAVVDLPT